MVQFLRGFVIGAVASAAVVIIVTPRSGAETRQMIVKRVNGSIEIGRKAAAEHEQKMWEEFRQKQAASHTDGRTNSQPPSQSPW